MSKKKTYVITSLNNERVLVDSLDGAAKIIGSSPKTVANKVNSGMTLKGFTIETLDSYLVYHKEEI